MVNEEQSLDANISEESSAPEQEVTTNEQQTSSSSEASTAASDVQKEQPFHEHPRFKELIEERREYRERLEQEAIQRARLEERLSAFERMQQKSAESQEPAIFSKLDGIDPDLAKVMRDMYSKAQNTSKFERELAELKQSYQAEIQQRQSNTAIQEIDRLHSEFKAPKEIQGAIRAMIREAASENPKLTLKDVPALYKQAFDSMNGYIENIKRADRQAYSEAKKKDAKAPATQPKGKSPGTPKSEFAANPDVARSQLVERVMQQIRASKET